MINEPSDCKYVFNFTEKWKQKQKQTAERKVVNLKPIYFELMVSKLKS